jgi:hypothetical protein
MYVALLIFVLFLVWAGATLLIDAWLRRRPGLIERLRPYQSSVADKAEWWIRRQ